MDKVQKFILANPTLGLALASAYVYLCTYEYETSYLKEFNISSNFFFFDINIVLRDSYEVLLAAGEIIILHESLFMLCGGLLKKYPNQRKIIRATIALVLLGIIFLLYFPYKPKTSLLMVSIIAGVFIGAFLIFFIWIATSMLIEKIQKKTYIPPEQTAITNEATFSKWYSLVITIGYPFYICSMLGQGAAFHETTFQVFNDSTKAVVIRKYGDALICKDLTKLHKVGAKTIIYKISDAKSVTLTDQRLGHISVTDGDL